MVWQQLLSLGRYETRSWLKGAPLAWLLPHSSASNTFGRLHSHSCFRVRSFLETPATTACDSGDSLGTADAFPERLVSPNLHHTSCSEMLASLCSEVLLDFSTPNWSCPSSPRELLHDLSHDASCLDPFLPGRISAQQMPGEATVELGSYWR